jgi:hypothetical protein
MMQFKPVYAKIMLSFYKSEKGGYSEKSFFNHSGCFDNVFNAISSGQGAGDGNGAGNTKD